MATGSVSLPRDNSLQALRELVEEKKREVRDNFMELRTTLQQCEDSVAGSLDKLYSDTRESVESTDRTIQQLEEAKTSMQATLVDNKMSAFLQATIQSIDVQIAEVRNSTALVPKGIQLEWSRDVVKQSIQTFCKVISLPDNTLCVTGALEPIPIPAKTLKTSECDDHKKEVTSLEADLNEAQDLLAAEFKAIETEKEKNTKQVAFIQQLNEYKREIEELKEQVKKEISEKNEVLGELAGHRNEQKLRDLTIESQHKKQTETDTNGVAMETYWDHLDAAKALQHKQTAVKSKDYINLENYNQHNECYIGYKEFEKPKDLCKAKLESEFNSSKLIHYMHSEKIRLMDELTRTKRELAESKDQIAKLRENIGEAPPLPARCLTSPPLSPRKPIPWYRF